MLFAKDKPASFWETVRTDNRYQTFREELEWLYNRYCSEEIKALSYTDYMLTYRTGSRKEYERAYFARRARLNTLAAMCLIYGDDYISALEDMIWAICDEYCWALPAHVHLETELGLDTTYIDLFAAETGFALSEIFHLLGDRFSMLISMRMQAEIKRRIIDSYLTRTFRFETMRSNWAAVCAGSVGAAFIYQAPALFESVRPRLEQTMEYFFSSFKADGVCREGIGYWYYGFGFFTYYAQLVRAFSGGSIDYFKEDRVRVIASFPQKIFMQADVAVSFSDGSPDAAHHIGLTHFLHNEYPQDVAVLPLEYRNSYINGTGDDAFRWCHLIRSIVWYDSTLNEAAPDADMYVYMPDSAWYVRRNKSYAFAAKAGDNDEPHNHNDIGNFILTAGGRQILCDLGAGEYTLPYFDADTRYDFFCNSSRSHNVPIIDGQYQQAGAAFTGAVVTADENALVMEIQDAYGFPNVKRLTRDFRFDENGIQLTDTFDMDPVIAVTERFVTKIKPVVTDGKVRIDNVSICFDSNIWQAAVSDELFMNHAAEPETVYCIDFAANTPVDRFEVLIQVD